MTAQQTQQLFVKSENVMKRGREIFNDHPLITSKVSSSIG
jgi:hypothetical protein